MFDAGLIAAAADVLAGARAQSLKIATAESCTGGLVGALLTEIPGASDVFERGFITYSNQAKTEMLGVPSKLWMTHGAVSEQVARAMAEGAMAKTFSHMAVAVTGIAGPGGGTADKPVGLVHIAAARRQRPTLHRQFLFGDTGRHDIRMRSAAAAIQMLAALL